MEGYLDSNYFKSFYTSGFIFKFWADGISFNAFTSFEEESWIDKAEWFSILTKFWFDSASDVQLAFFNNWIYNESFDIEGVRMGVSIIWDSYWPCLISSFLEIWVSFLKFWD